MHLKRITNHLLFLTLIYLPLTDAEFIRYAVKGATVLLPCHSLPNDTEQVSVKWINRATSKTICEWDINKNQTISIRQCPRFKINRTSLIIENVQFSDSGDYSCKTTIVIPPPSLDSSSDVKLQVEAHPGLSLQKQNSGNDSCILLLCSLEGLNPELVNFTWIRAGRGSLHSFTTYDMTSSLRLCKPDWSDGDTIICRANYSNRQTQTQITLTSKKDRDNLTLLISCSAAAGIILCIITIVIFCKCRKRDENGSIVFTNKVYENFSFATARQNTQPIAKPQPEECIYEN